MVYEVKCDNCGKIIDFGSRKPENDLSKDSKLPENAIEFDGSTYCRECVQKLIRFGAGDIQSRLDYLMDKMNEALEALGIPSPGPEER